MQKANIYSLPETAEGDKLPSQPITRFEFQGMGQTATQPFGNIYQIKKFTQGDSSWWRAGLQSQAGSAAVTVTTDRQFV